MRLELIFKIVKNKIRRFLTQLNFNFIKLKNSIGVRTIRNQNRNYKNIPIIIISFNQLAYLRKLIGFLQKYGYSKIIIIDNASTYQPLLDYFDEIQDEVTIHRMKKNYGHMVFWENEYLYNKYSKGYYAVTDADIVPDENCPENFIQHFKEILDSNSIITKVGFSLRIDNIPDSNPFKENIIEWEKKFWVNKDTKGNYLSPIDTTFALYRPSNFHKFSSDFFSSIRTGYPFIAEHGGWYIDPENLSEEQKFYMKTAGKSSSWKISNKGELLNPIYHLKKN